MHGLSTLGIWHTAISVLALAMGVVSIVQNREIHPRTKAGKAYVLLTVLTCVTALGIFAHGGFNKAHALAIMTLLVLAIAALAGNTSLFGKAGRNVETVAYSTTFFFHLVPGITETLTRLPASQPVFDNPDAAGLQLCLGVVFLAFLVCASLQWRSVKRAAAP